MTNWASNSGFGGTIGAPRLSGGSGRGTGSGLGSSTGRGADSSPWNVNSLMSQVRNRGTQVPGYGTVVPMPDLQANTQTAGYGQTITQGGTGSTVGSLDFFTEPDNERGTGTHYSAWQFPNGLNNTPRTPMGTAQYTEDFNNLANSLAGPRLNALEMEAGLNQQYGAANASLNALKAAGMRSDTNYDLARLDNRNADLGIDRGLNALKLEGLGIDRRENETERDYIARLRGIAAKQFTSDSNRISFEGQDQARQIKSRFLTGGTLFAPGHRYEQGANYLRTLNDLEGRRLSHDEQNAGFDRRHQQTLFSDQRIGLSEREVGLANQRLDLMANNLGIDRNQMIDTLNRGLEALGIQGQVDALELVARAAGIQAQRGQIGMESAQQAMQMINSALNAGMAPGDMYNIFGG